jgi:hypothetical protein
MERLKNEKIKRAGRLDRALLGGLVVTAGLSSAVSYEGLRRMSAYTERMEDMRRGLQRLLDRDNEIKQNEIDEMRTRLSLTEREVQALKQRKEDGGN